MIPKRKYGKTDTKLSVIGFGGIVVMNADARTSARVVAEAVEAGVNYFDVAPTYGNAEEMLGPALQPYREKVFLACKTERRDARGAREHLVESLKRLRTDRFDLYQLHAVTDVVKDVEAAFAPGGAMDTLVAAREEGLVRYLGFSAHSPAAALAAMEKFDFDSILYPVNLACHFKSRFDQEPLRMAASKGMAVLALKAMARGAWDSANTRAKREDYPKCWYEPCTTRDEALAGLRFALSQPGVTAVLPPGDERLFRLALSVAAQIETAEPDFAAAEAAVEEIVPIFR
ncbi:MAG: aldo/keto reductase [Candidatus Sumerlaeaceae bacterium]|nr:aldo/keto reductase [Candidatus Sumerlaeaceae bacterium]